MTECDYCDTEELAYEFDTDRGRVARCLPCLAVERAQSGLKMPFERFVEFEYAEMSYQDTKGWLTVLGRLRQDRQILVRDETKHQAVSENVRHFLINTLGEDAYKKPGEIQEADA
jgi:hypothetical protein